MTLNLVINAGTRSGKRGGAEATRGFSAIIGSSLSVTRFIEHFTTYEKRIQ